MITFGSEWSGAFKHNSNFEGHSKAYIIAIKEMVHIPEEVMHNCI